MVRAAAARNSAFNLEKAISIGLKSWEIEQACSDRLNGLSNTMDLVSGQVVHDNGVARP